MKNWFQKSAAAVLTASMLVSQAVPAMAAETADAVQEESLKIAVLSDTHYLSPGPDSGYGGFYRALEQRSENVRGE